MQSGPQPCQWVSLNYLALDHTPTSPLEVQDPCLTATPMLFLKLLFKLHFKFWLFSLVYT